MDVRFINPFIGAIGNVFQTMLGLEVEYGKPQFGHTENVGHDVSGIIGLSGDVEGSVVVSFPMASALKIAGTFGGMEMTEPDEDFADAIGELANMISGNAKKDFEGLNVMISVPSVVVGCGHTVKSNRVLPTVNIPCQCEAGEFVVEIGMRTVNSSEAQAVKVEAEVAI
jgi:chemotaxis protein CheX